MYLTYDIQQTDTSEHQKNPTLLKNAKEFSLPEPILGWEVGEFENHSGVPTYGVKISYNDPVIGPAAEVIEIPSTAQNVQIHSMDLPREYRDALKHAA